MTLSEAVKAAGIGGRVRKFGPWSQFDYLVTDNGVEVQGEAIAVGFKLLTADDWTVVQRAPREWTIVLHKDGNPCTSGCSSGSAVRVREVVE